MNKGFVKQLRAHMRQTAFSQSEEGSAEVAQAVIRVVLMLVMGIYAWWGFHFAHDPSGYWPAPPRTISDIPGAQDVFLVLAFSIAASLFILVTAWRQRRPTIARRVLAYISDFVCLGAAIAISGAILPLMWVPLIWLCIGNGIRFGRRELWISASASLLLVFACRFTPAWEGHGELLVLMGAVMLLIPGYIVFMFSLQRSAFDRAITAEALLAKERQSSMEKMLATVRTDIDGHQRMLGVVASEVMDPALRILTEAQRGSVEDLPIIARQAEYIISVLEDMEDIDRLATGKFQQDPVEIRGSSFLAQLVETLQTVLPPGVTLTGSSLDMNYRLQADFRWISRALVSLTRAVTRELPPGCALVIEGQVSRPGESAWLDLRLIVDEPQVMDVHNLVALDIAERLLDALGGRYMALPTQTTLYQVELPVSTTEIKTTIGPTLTSSDKQDYVVVIDGCRSELRRTSHLLNSMGLHAIPLLKPERAAEVIQQRKPKLVIVDYYMNRHSGPDVIRELKALDVQPPPAFVLVSGDATDQMRHEAHTLGAAFEPKEITPEVIRRHLH